MALAWVAARPLSDNIYVSLLVKVGVAATVYLLLLRWLGAQIMSECLDFLKSKFGRRK